MLARQVRGGVRLGVIAMLEPQQKSRTGLDVGEDQPREGVIHVADLILADRQVSIMTRAIHGAARADWLALIKACRRVRSWPQRCSIIMTSG